MNDIEKRMEELREQLNRLAYDIDNCDVEKLLNTSRELDKVINEYIKAKKKVE
ncbi:aspartyl-phosphate phosphatase Spo0E family protein [Proteiniborus sp.]|uniref:aspartyl-phosphate phosphatase Spo0E family protein n=1 Tax=Proteiniborus sp. TaxID=2079015 RepID=UPI00331FF42D